MNLDPIPLQYLDHFWGSSNVGGATLTQSSGDPPKAYLAGKEVAKLSWRPLLEVTLILGCVPSGVIEIGDFPSKKTLFIDIYRGFYIAMFDYQRVIRSDCKSAKDPKCGIFLGKNRMNGNRNTDEIYENYANSLVGYVGYQIIDI